MPNNKQLLERIDQLEMNQSFHDDSIEALERTIALQHQEIQLLEKKLSLLTDYIKTIKQESIKDPQDETPPPHY
ncbi:SlyX family protein [Thiomicrorhabdus sp. Milos-T2]|uniref:SlyX family protein n=1 Tax=Thiomicrorhabdus sp. Milos-T2 TaxID=90814 RepID=UPI0004944599|nr:SlyX family protein [Thiomicrorhabdus sp. Milos-T2]